MQGHRPDYDFSTSNHRNPLVKMNDPEIWRYVPGYEGAYQVSNHGNIRSLDRVVTYTVRYKGKQLKPVATSDGYRVAHLTINGKGRTFPIHCLVAKAFIPNPKKKPEVNHKDGVKHHNAVENLEWATDQENSLHAVRTGLSPHAIGENNTNSKHSDNVIRDIRASKASHKTLSQIYGLSPGSIWRIRTFKTRKSAGGIRPAPHRKSPKKPK